MSMDDEPNDIASFFIFEKHDLKDNIIKLNHWIDRI